MSAYLPFRSEIEAALEEEMPAETDGDGDQDDPFATSDGESDADQAPTDPEVKALVYERELLYLDPLPRPQPSTTASSTPVFLGHGKEDEKKPMEVRETAARTIRAAGYKVQWKAYDGLGHWYKIPDEIDDILEFIRSHVGWVVSDQGLAE
ncbi:hypothetical protein F5Y15DRAFT_399413 [Xylariaceae sp. FL0016]|nr:hypothetical protein F5Y15DRAFT_399413 [Xylariaceae sp. FL0016]